MKDLIDRQALLRWFDNWYDHDEFSVGYITGIIGEQPPVDAQPVRHGHWDTVEDWDDLHYQCSECGAEFVLIDGTPQDNDYLYCPSCGARMDGD